MSDPMKRIIIIALLLAAASVVHSEGIYNPTAPSWSNWITGSVGGSSSGGVGNPGTQEVRPNGDILMVDAASLILQTDSASLICRAGGC
jgi:hypothetical protein